MAILVVLAKACDGASVTYTTSMHDHERVS